MARKTQKTAPKGKASKAAEKPSKRTAPAEDEDLLTTKDIAAAVRKSTARVREVLRQDDTYADGKYTPYRWTPDSKEYRRVIALFEEEDEEPAPKPKKAAKTSKPAAKAAKPTKKGKKVRKAAPVEEDEEELEDLEDALEEEDEEE